MRAPIGWLDCCCLATTRQIDQTDEIKLSSATGRDDNRVFQLKFFACLLARRPQPITFLFFLSVCRLSACLFVDWRREESQTSDQCHDRKAYWISASPIYCRQTDQSIDSLPSSIANDDQIQSNWFRNELTNSPVHILATRRSKTTILETRKSYRTTDIRLPSGPVDMGTTKRCIRRRQKGLVSYQWIALNRSLHVAAEHRASANSS